MLAIRWFQVDDLGQGAKIAAITFFIIKLTGLVMTSVTFPRVERMAAWKVISLGNLALAALAGLMAVLAVCGWLNFVTLTALAAVAAIATGLTAPHLPRLQVELMGALEQHKLGYRLAIAESVGRVLAGYFGGILARRGTWVLFVIDALSFVPLILFLLLTQDGMGSKAVPLPQAEKKAKMPSVRDGIRYIWRNDKLRTLYGFDLVRLLFFQSLPFTLSAEIIKTDFSRGPEVFGIWIALTGLGGLLGSIIGSQASLKGRGMLVSLVLSGVCVLAASLTGSYQAYIGCYVLYVAFLAPPSTMIAAEYRLVPNEWISAVRRAVVISESGIAPACIVVLTNIGAQLNMSSKQTLATTSLIGLVCYGILAYRAKTRGLIKGLITGVGKQN